MQSIPFIKAQALGNDFVMIQSDAGMPDLTPELIRNLADRRRGIGCDQVVEYAPFSLKGADRNGVADLGGGIWNIHVTFYNADGSKAQACGNGSRALANYLFTTLNYPSPLILQTKGGDLKAEKICNKIVALTYPEPKQTYHWDLTALPQTFSQHSPYQTINVGNPHLICFVEDLSQIDVLSQGPLLENNPIFKNEGINVSFAQILDKRSIKLAVWERGAGFTGACGTAACATMGAAFSLGLVDDTVTIHQQGGELGLTWKDGVFKLEGPAETVFTGTYYIPHSYS